MRLVLIACGALATLPTLAIGCGPSFEAGGAGGASSTTAGAGGKGTTSTTSTTSTGGMGGMGGGMPSTSSTGGAGGCAVPADACSQCAAKACPGFCGCENDASCAALVVCDEGCHDDGCRATCAMGNPAIAQAAIVGNCAALHCGMTCLGAVALTLCESCQLNKCTPSMTTCLGDPPCACLAGCAAHPNDTGCASKCGPMPNPGATAELDIVLTCTQIHCHEECPPPNMGAGGGAQPH